VGVGLGGLDDDIAAQVGDIGSVVAVAFVIELERRIERDLRAGDRLDDALLGLRKVLDGP
jgi:hypothetical protein